MAYKLPGVELTDVTNIQTASSSNTQRIPCFIGTASTVKTAYNEAVARANTGYVDNLLNYSTGITSILKAGTQIGLNDIVEGTDISVNKTTGEVTWLIHTETRAVASGVYGAELFASLDDFVTFGTAVNGVAATAGTALVGLDIIGTADSGLDLGTTYNFRVNGDSYSITTSSTSSVVTVNDVATLMNTALLATNFSVSFVTNDIVVSTKLTGVGNTVTLTAGAADDLFAELTGWTAFGTATAGADATSGYQGAGLSILGADDTGLNASSRYYFKVNGTTYSILTSSGTVTYTALAALLDTALSSANIDVDVYSGDLRFTNSTTGITSTVALGYATAVAASNGQLRVQLSTNTIFARKPGKVSITCTINEEDLTFGIADDIEPGDGYITLSGTNTNLNKILVGTNLTLITIPAVAASGTYYVTYQYNRPDDDYTFKTFKTLTDLKADYGDCIPANQLVMIGSLAFDYYNIPQIACIQVPATNQNSDYVAALQKCRNRDVQTIALLNSSTTVRSAGISHVNDRNLPANGKYRLLYTGAPALTPIGDIDTNNTVASMSYAIKNEAVVFVNATRAKFYYLDPVTNVDTYTEVDGAFIAAAAAAYRDSFAYPSQTLMRSTIGGLELYAEDFEDYYSQDALEAAGAGSAFLIGLGNSNSLVVKDDLTTNNTSVESNNINIITAKHYIAKDVALQLDRTFIGSLITNRGVYQVNVETFLHKLFSSYKAARIIENVDTITVTLPTDRRDTVKIYYSYYAIYTHKYVEGEYAISI